MNQSTGKQIALTFDDGPNPTYTTKLLDGLRERGVHATFFLLGQNVEQYPEIVRTMHEDGHLIGNHTYHHVQLTEVGEEKFKEEIPRYMIKHQVRPGMTGWAQVNGYRGDTSIEVAMQHNDSYSENVFSFCNNIQIQFNTFKIYILFDCYLVIDFL